MGLFETSHIGVLAQLLSNRMDTGEILKASGFCSSAPMHHQPILQDLRLFDSEPQVHFRIIFSPECHSHPSVHGS